MDCKVELIKDSTMKRYIKPECQLVELKMESLLQNASEPEINDEVGNGQWMAPRPSRPVYQTSDIWGYDEE